MKDPFASVTFGNALSLRVDGAVGAMTLAPNRRDAVRAGRRGLFIIDLDDPFTTPRWLHHITSWEVADVQYSPHACKPSWCVSTSNQKALLWDLARPSDNSIVNVLHQHSRAITDINFHPGDPEILATCSIDTFVYQWDMRTPRKPVAQWAEWRAGATQVKWNHENPYEVASAHDHSLYLWDTRKGGLPVVKIGRAHTGKINGIDFSQGSSHIVTCSNDHKIKVWDLAQNSTFSIFDDATSSLRPSVVVEADFPVARARHLPFGADKAFGIMPLRGGGDAVHVVNYDAEHHRYLESGDTQHCRLDSAYSFKGHKGPMKDFLWRTRHPHYAGFESKTRWKDYQLVTWSSADDDLKLWPHDDDLYKKVNYNPLYQNMLSTFKSDAGDSDASTIDSQSGYSYDSYCVEPPLTLGNVLNKNNGDLLSSLTLFQIAKNKNVHAPSEINHLDWISGVRMGRNEDKYNGNPTNLGEEVSIIANKFPKVRFEKISVSTGELIMSLRGPVPYIEPKEAPAPEQDEKEEPSEPVDPSVSVPATDAKDTAESTSVVEDADVTANETTTQESEPKLVFIRLEIKFPSSYPYLEGGESKSRRRHQKPKEIKFNIEETHELTSEIKQVMLKTLSEIAQFYTNKHQKFCLEYVARYLMGDKIELDDALVSEPGLEPDVSDDIIEVGNEDWADDLITQQPNHGYDMMSSSGDEFDENYSDIMPAINDDDDLQRSTGSLFKDQEVEQSHPPQIPGASDANMAGSGRMYDSTPMPKGCGAVWAPNGNLVCFFIPKQEEEEEESKALQKFSIFKFTDAGFSVGNDHESHVHTHDNSDESSHDESVGDDDSDSSGDSFTNDFEDIEEDITNRFRIPGLFKTSVGLGNRYVSGGYGGSSRGNRFNKTVSNGGSASNYRSSLRGGDSKKKEKLRKNKNIVGIFDFRHLWPDKQELASEYRVLGDSPENLSRHNSQVAMKYGLKEIAEAWKLLEMVLMKDVKASSIHPVYSANVLDPTTAKNAEAMNHLMQVSEITQKMVNNPHYRFYWGCHPFGHAWLIKEMMKYFERKGNLQMVVMLSCILFENRRNIKNNSMDFFNVPIHTPYNSRPPPPSVVSLRRLTEGVTPDETERHFSFHESISTERSSPQNINTPAVPEGGMRIKHRHSSVSMHRKDIHGSYNYPINSSSDVTSLRGESPDKAAFLRKSYPTSPLPENTFSKIRNQKSRLKKNIGRKTNRKTINPPPVVTIDFQNTDTLDLFDDVYTQSLLSSQDIKRIKMYREQYANLLFAWELPANRIKILKFNYPDSDFGQFGSNSKEHRCNFGLRSKESPGNEEYVNGVSLVDTAQENPWIVNSDNTLRYCNLCSLLVTKRLVVCTNCEHVLHSHCALDWWSNDDLEEECPSGCGCKCLNYRL